MITIKTLKFNNIEDLCEDISNKIDEFGEDDDIAFVAKYEVMREFVRQLILYGFEINSIELNNEDVKNYYDEYLCSIDGNDIWVEPMKHENGYLNDDSTITYVSDDCNSAVLHHLGGGIIYEVSLGDDECDDCEHGDVEFALTLFDNSDLEDGEHLEDIFKNKDKNNYACLIMDEDDCVAGFKYVIIHDNSYESGEIRSNDGDYLVSKMSEVLE